MYDFRAVYFCGRSRRHFHFLSRNTNNAEEKIIHQAKCHLALNLNTAYETPLLSPVRPYGGPDGHGPLGIIIADSCNVNSDSTLM